MARYRLGDIAPIQQGVVPSANEYWLLNLDMVESNTGRIIDYVYVPKNEIGTSTVSFDESNVLYSKLRPYLNKVVLPPKAGYATSEMLPLHPDTEVITQKYLLYYLRSKPFVSYINEKTNGAKMPRANITDLKAKEIDCPSIERQNSITACFDRIVSIIGLLESQLQKLDDLVKARFVEMFANEDRQMKMEEVCSIITDGTHQPPKFVDSGIPFIFVSNITGNMVTYNAEKFIDEDTYDELIKRTPIEIGDVLLSTVGSYGHPAVVRSNKKFLFQRHIAYLKPKKNIVDSDYLHGAFLSPDAQMQIENGVKGIAQKTLNLSDIKKMTIPVPEMDRQKQFAAFVAQVDQTKSAIQATLDETQTLFDSLMQEYFG